MVTNHFVCMSSYFEELGLTLQGTSLKSSSLSWITTYPHFLFVFLCSTIAALPFAHNGDFTCYWIELGFRVCLSWKCRYVHTACLQEFGLRACTAWSWGSLVTCQCCTDCYIMCSPECSTHHLGALKGCHHFCYESLITDDAVSPNGDLPASLTCLVLWSGICSTFVAAWIVVAGRCGINRLDLPQIT